MPARLVIQAGKRDLHVYEFSIHLSPPSHTPMADNVNKINKSTNKSELYIEELRD
jgi:hypothetical protein